MRSSGRPLWKLWLSWQKKGMLKPLLDWQPEWKTQLPVPNRSLCVVSPRSQRIGNTQAFAAVAARLGDRDPPVRLAAVNALAQIAEREDALLLMQHMVPKLEGPFGYVREGTVKAVAHFADVDWRR